MNKNIYNKLMETIEIIKNEKFNINYEMKFNIIYDQTYEEYVIYHNIRDFYYDEKIENKISEILENNLVKLGFEDFMLSYNLEIIEKMNYEEVLETETINLNYVPTSKKFSLHQQYNGVLNKFKGSSFKYKNIQSDNVKIEDSEFKTCLDAA